MLSHTEKYRNTFRFLLGNLKDKFQKQNFEQINIKDFDELEQYILHKIFYISKSVEDNLKKLQFS